MNSQKYMSIVLSFVYILMFGCQTKYIPKREFEIPSRPTPIKATKSASNKAPIISTSHETEVGEPIRWFLVIIGSMLFVVYGTAWYLNKKNGTN